MYRNDEKKVLADKWQGWADFFQFGTLALLFIFMFALEAMSKDAARVFVWYGAGFLFICATAGFILGNRTIKYRKVYFDAEHKRVIGLFDKAIEQAKKSKS